MDLEGRKKKKKPQTFFHALRTRGVSSQVQRFQKTSTILAEGWALWQTGEVRYSHFQQSIRAASRAKCFPSWLQEDMWEMELLSLGRGCNRAHAPLCPLPPHCSTLGLPRVPLILAFKLRDLEGESCHLSHLQCAHTSQSSVNAGICQLRFPFCDTGALLVGWACVVAVGTNTQTFIKSVPLLYSIFSLLVSLCHVLTFLCLQRFFTGISLIKHNQGKQG